MKRILFALALCSSIALVSCGNCPMSNSDGGASGCSAETQCPAKQAPTGPTVQAMGMTVQLTAPLPKVGEEAPDVILTSMTMDDVQISSLKGHAVVLNIFPSIDTKVCSLSVRHFNELAAGLPNVKVLCVSMDLPFALSRFCGAEGISNVEAMSAFRSEFPYKYGVRIADSRLRGLLARSVIVINADGKIGYVQLVQNMGDEPNYDQVMDYLKSIGQE